MDDTCFTGSISHFVQFWDANTFLLANIINSGVIAWDSAKSKSLIVNFIPGALSTNSSDWIVSSFAAASTILENFIDSASNNTVASSVKSLTSRTLTDLKDWVVS